MGKYWDQMKILKSKIGGGELFISLENPSFSSSCEVSNSFDKKDLSIFYSKNYKIGQSNNTISLSIKNLENYQRVDSEILVLRNPEIIGSMISILIPIKIETNLKINTLKRTERFISIESNSLVFGCASFLILDRKYRKKGLGMVLIQESLQVLYNNGGLGAYFINSVSRCVNSIPLNSWLFPLNLNKLDACSFPYPQNYKSLFEISEKEYIKVDEKNSERALEAYLNLCVEKKFYFCPSLEFWNKWIKSFDTYMVEEDSKIVGIYSFDYHIVRYPIYNCDLKNGTLLLYAGTGISTMLYSAKQKFDLLLVYEIGELNERLLSSHFFQKSEKKFINFYNTKIFLKPNEISIPIF